MGNVLRILKRDILRLFKAPAALVVVGALLVLPSVYTWYNVLAFWDPYNSTGDLKVGVVNQDVGAETDMTGKLNVGDTIVEKLSENDQLSWVNEDYGTAMDELASGGLYAVYVIPDDFTECLVSPLTGKIKSPELQYYVNEKLGPVAPKITDVASSTLEQTINSMFVATVSEAAVEAIDSAVADAEQTIASSKSKVDSRISVAKNAIDEVRSALAEMSEAADAAKGKVSSAVVSMDEASTSVAAAETVINDVSSEAAAIRTLLTDLSTQAMPKLASALVKVSQVTSSASTAADGFAAKAGEAQTKADLAAARVRPLIDTMRSLAADLQSASESLPDDTEASQKAKASLAEAASKLSEHADQLQSAADTASELGARIGTDANEVATAASSLNESAQKASNSPGEFADSLFGGAATSIDTALTQIESACSRLSAAASNLGTTISQAKLSLAQLDGVLDDCKTAVTQTESLVSGLQSDLDSVSADVNLLAKSGTIAQLVGDGTLNARSISEFMGSPTELKTVEYYSPNAYGSAMAPLFMNLTFWIGAFMLVIIMRLEADSEGVEEVTLGQRYVSRLILFSALAVMQAVVCCVGTLALGVQAANVPALFVASAVASLAYESIIYALSTMFRHAGKGLCIVLVFAQIPGGSGLYPVEMTSSFFRSIYPFLPFSYGIDAMREAIGGLYGSHYANDLTALAAFFVAFLVLGLVVGPLMTNVTRMTARQVREGDLFNGEEVFSPERPYRLTQVLSALSDREEYRTQLHARYDWFLTHYPLFIRASIVLGVGVPVVLSVLLALDAAEKVTLLTILLLWMIALFAVLVVIESLRDSFERQLGLETMSQESMLGVFAKRNRLLTAGGRALRRTGSSSDSAEESNADELAAGESSCDGAVQPSDDAPSSEGGSDA